MLGYQLTGQIPRLRRVTLPEPAPGFGEVVVEIAATSINYRDFLLAGMLADIVPLSDGAGVICAVGEGVSESHIGERVVIGFMPGWIDGAFSLAKQATSLGGPGVNGVLAQRVAVPAAAVVKVPDTMSLEQAACLPCAGVTAWAALFERRPLAPGETVLLLGTGGVSVIALQLAKRAGARVIITSSSDAKLERAAALGADEIINYARTPDWDARVLDLTEGLGADLAIEVGGPATLNRTLNAVRADGRIALMGILTGFAGEIDTMAILNKRITLQGVYVGSVAMLAAVARAGVMAHIDQAFDFNDAEAAYQAIAEAKHFGKLVVRVGA